ncbi:MAG: TRAP transporter small permease [Alphaproteobacteria bacterium]|nr:TRAP transporter small permease [Alphaproteobacteria bacterium]
MKAIERLFSKLSTASTILGGLAMVMMMLQVSADVLLKYAISYPIPGTLETVSSYYMVALVFLPLGNVTKHHEHITVELFTQGLGPRALAWVNALAELLASVYVVMLTWRGAEEAAHMTVIRESWETALWDMQVWPSRWFVPVGCGLMFIYLVIHFIDDVSFGLRGKRIMGEGKQPKLMNLE